MAYQDIYRESNEQAVERFELITERILQIRDEATVESAYEDYFKSTADFLLKLADILKQKEQGQLEERTAELCERQNQSLYEEILPQNYEMSYANPVYAAEKLGQYAAVLSLLRTHFRSQISRAFREDKLCMTAAMELFVEVYNIFEAGKEHGGTADERELERSVYWYFHDYSELFVEESLRRIIDSKEDFETEIVMESELKDLRYLYRYGAYIGSNELEIAAFLNEMPEDEIKAMADTYTEGYRMGFELSGKDLNKKQTVQIRYPIGFERMVRAAVCNFEKLGLSPTMAAQGTAPNKQYDYDHREDRAYYFDKAYVERTLEVRKTYFEEKKTLAAGFAGPAVIEVFGEVPFSPETKKEALHYDDKQQQLSVYEMSMAGQLNNEYMKGEERSFTIIAYPVPSIGSRFKEIFAETVKINTLDYTLYRDMQQKMIDVLDEARQVHIKGKGANKTDLYVTILPLMDRKVETAFENCVADVNIPVGEVFTSPVLSGTTGKLFVSQVYLGEFKYLNLEIDFKDGMIVDYTCSNFPEVEENKKYIKKNVLMHHDTLPMGEFAIGTNTTAYRMARDFDIADKLPILIAEKTGPHFAVGDTCYSHEEDNMSYNPDGKAIVARENDISALRKEDMAKAYFNCHTDITIPYDELDKITVIRADGTSTDVIADGRFVLEGTEPLNEPLDA